MEMDVKEKNIKDLSRVVVVVVVGGVLCKNTETFPGMVSPNMQTKRK